LSNLQCRTANATMQCCPICSAVPLTRHCSVVQSAVPYRWHDTAVLSILQCRIASTTMQYCPICSAVPLTRQCSVVQSGELGPWGGGRSCPLCIISIVPLTQQCVVSYHQFSRQVDPVFLLQFLPPEARNRSVHLANFTVPNTCLSLCYSTVSRPTEFLNMCSVA